MGRIVRTEFLARDTVTVARELIGVHLCRRVAPRRIVRWPITEAEAYDGPNDRACHAARGRTLRNAVMFGPAGAWYVYLCYGMHWMVNIVTGPADYPAAVLLRGAGEVSGPGRLTKALGINGSLDRTPARPESGLWLEFPPTPFNGQVEATPRIGIGYAGPEWVAAPYRFVATEKR